MKSGTWTRNKFKRVFTILPNGNIREHLDDKKKTSISEGQYINPKNIAPTLISGTVIKIIEVYADREYTTTEEGV